MRSSLNKKKPEFGGDLEGEAKGDRDRDSAMAFIALRRESPALRLRSSKSTLSAIGSM